MEDIYNYIGDEGGKKRAFFEGRAIMKSNFIIETRIKKKEEKLLEILSLCLQTSDLSGAPHEINIKLEEKISNVCINYKHLNVINNIYSLR